MGEQRARYKLPSGAGAGGLAASPPPHAGRGVFRLRLRVWG